MNILVTAPNDAQNTSAERPLVHVVIVGHVDDGKSTLIGRLLHETGSLPDGKLDQLKAVSARRGMRFEWSFLLDALQTERDQGITIDTSQIRFRTPSCDVVLIDAPGHTEFLRNMITGAAQADAALLLVDDSEGVREQTRRHGHLLHLLGVKQVAVVINKMDRVNFDEARFRNIETEVTQHLLGLGIAATASIPISARHGDGVAIRTPALDWYGGPTVLEALDGFAPAPDLRDLPLRLPVQAVYKFDDRRIIAGRVASGHLSVGDEIVIAPSGKTAIVQSIESWPPLPFAKKPRGGVTGQSIGITLDRELFIERGCLISHEHYAPAAARRIDVRLFWLHEKPLMAGAEISVRIGPAQANAVVSAVHEAVDPGSLLGDITHTVGQNGVGEIELTLARPLAADRYADNPKTGRVALEVDGRIAGGGLLLRAKPENEIVKPRADAKQPFVQSIRAPSLIERASGLAARCIDLPAVEALRQLRAEVSGSIVFTTSFGLEDQVVTHLVREAGIDVDVVTLDTGRLFPETYDVWAQTERRYGLRIQPFYPDAKGLEDLVARQGINGFRESIAARIACCNVRKVIPLDRSLAGAGAWITGLRANQSDARTDVSVVTVEPVRELIKFSPLAGWSRDAVAEYATAHDVPRNVLHQRGFASIGCAPCTRAIKANEPERAGRWWWEDDNKRECGLHIRGEQAVVSAFK